MSIREVVRHPDPLLKEVCASPWTTAQLVDLTELAQDLIDTMRSFPGCVGIAAPQIGELVRAIVIDVTGHPKARSNHGLIVMTDPIVSDAEGQVRMREGCLSIPDFTGNVRRPKSVRVGYRDLDGTACQIECDAFEARVVLHEIDHLDGILFLDRVASAKDVFPRRHYR